jgi:hypothetical protein
MFEKIPGLASERAVRLTALVEQCRPLLDQGTGMDAVQRLLHDRGIAVMDAIRVTRELMGAGPDTLQQATTVVLTSPVRTDAPPAHQELVDMLERAQDIADAARARARTDETTIIAIDGPGGSGKTTLAAKVAELLDGATVIHGDDFYRPMPEHEREQLDAQLGYQHYFDWQRLRDQVLAPLRAGRPARTNASTGPLESSPTGARSALGRW